MAYQSLYLSIFLSLLQNFPLQIPQLLFQTGSLNFVYMIRTTKCITENKTKVLRFILPFFLFIDFSISHSEEMNTEISIKDFSGTT